MPAIIPTSLANVPDHGQIIGPTGAPVTVTPEFRASVPRALADMPVAMLVPSYSDAILNIIQAGFTIDVIREEQEAGP